MRIFNQIRKQLLKNGKLKDYSKYAFGEIFLVVIGILIALQINNWKKERDVNSERLITLEILKQSFSKNGEKIVFIITELHNTLSITNLRIQNTGPKIENISESILDSISIISVQRLELPYDLGNNIIITNQNSGLLSTEIRSLFLEYNALFSKYKLLENYLISLELKLRVNHQKYVALVDGSAFDNDLEVKPYNMFNSNIMGWLRDRDNQNISMEVKFKIEKSLLYLSELSDLNKLVLERLNKEIDGN